MTGPQGLAAGGRDLLRAGHAEREQAIESLKDAFADGRLTMDELDARAGRALAARTCAELAALTADIPPATGPAHPPAARPAHPPAPGGRWPLAMAAAKSGGCLAVATGAVRLAALADPGATAGPIPKFLVVPFFLIAAAAAIAALFIMVYGVSDAIDRRRSRRQHRNAITRADELPWSAGLPPGRARPPIGLSRSGPGSHRR
jgi:uncharacterized protein DUF1707